MPMGVGCTGKKIPFVVIWTKIDIDFKFIYLKFIFIKWYQTKLKSFCAADRS